MGKMPQREGRPHHEVTLEQRLEGGQGAGQEANGRRVFPVGEQQGQRPCVVCAWPVDGLARSRAGLQQKAGGQEDEQGPSP